MYTVAWPCFIHWNIPQCRHLSHVHIGLDGVWQRRGRLHLQHASILCLSVACTRRITVCYPFLDCLVSPFPLISLVIQILLGRRVLPRGVPCHFACMCRRHLPCSVAHAPNVAIACLRRYCCGSAGLAAAERDGERRRNGGTTERVASFQCVMCYLSLGLRAQPLWQWHMIVIHQS